MRHLLLSTVTVAGLLIVSPLLAQDLPILRPNFVMTPPMPEESTLFGVSIGVGTDAIVVGDMARRTAYVFDAETGEQRFAWRADTNSLHEDRQLGSDVAVWGDVALAGARTAITPNPDGLDFIGGGFLFNTRTGEQLHHLLVERADDVFITIPGFSVTLNDKYAVLGDNRGGAYVFDVNTGTQIHRFTPPFVNGASRAGRE